MALEGAGTGNPAGPRWPANQQGICFAEARGETRLRTCVRRLRGDRPSGRSPLACTHFAQMRGMAQMRTCAGCFGCRRERGQAIPAVPAGLQTQRGAVASLK